MRGSIRKHVAKDGTVTWRVRVDYYDPATGRRCQPQRTYGTKREAEAGLVRWLLEVQPDRSGDAQQRRRSPWQVRSLPGSAPPSGPRACLHAIAQMASDLQWRRQELTRHQVTSELRRIEEFALAALDALSPEEEAPAPLAVPEAAIAPASGPRTAPAEPTDSGAEYHVYRLLQGGVPFYVGQSRNVPLRVQAHIKRATGSVADYSARARAIREALASGQTITYDIVASAQSERDIRILEREWIVRMIAAGHALANGATL